MASDGKEVPQMQKQMKTLELQLEKTKQLHNQSIADIKGFKEKVGASKRERVIFDKVFKKLEYDLESKAKSLKERLGLGLKVEKDHESAGKQLFELKSFHETELKRIQKEMQKILKNPSLLTESRMIEGLDETSILHNDGNTRESKVPYNKNQTMAMNELELIEHYELFFTKILTLSEANDIDEIIQLLETDPQTKIDELYESLINQETEVDACELEIKEIQEKIDCLLEDNDEKDVIVDKVNVSNLNDKLTDIEERNVVVQRNSDYIFDDLEYLKENLTPLLDSLEMKFLDAQNNNAEITIGNLQEFVSPFEQKFDMLVELIKKIEDNSSISVDSSN